MLLRAALRLGISPADLELFTIGSLLDLLLYEPEEPKDYILATQEDFDRF